MNSTSDERIRTMTFASVYPHYVTKVEKKGRTTEDLNQVIAWLTGYGDKALQKCIADKVTFEQFFQDATLNPNAHLITGVICAARLPTQPATPRSAAPGSPASPVPSWPRSRPQAGPTARSRRSARPWR